MIKIWDEFKVLLREICLDEEGATLSSACFIDNQPNLLVAFKNHLYIIDHNKGWYRKKNYMSCILIKIYL